MLPVTVRSVPSYTKRLADGPQRPARRSGGRRRRRGARCTADELVAAEAGDGVAAPGDPRQAPAHLDQHPVAGVVAEASR